MILPDYRVSVHAASPRHMWDIIEPLIKALKHVAREGNWPYALYLSNHERRDLESSMFILGNFQEQLNIVPMHEISLDRPTRSWPELFKGHRPFNSSIKDGYPLVRALPQLGQMTLEHTVRVEQTV